MSLLTSNNSVKQFTNSLATNATSVALDGNGDIFYSAQLISNNNRAVFEIPSGDNVSTQLTLLGLTPNTDNLYIAVNGPGALFISDATAGTITKYTPTGGYFINQPLPAGLVFNIATGIISGTPSVASPATAYTVTGYNSKGNGSGAVNITTVAGTNTSLTGLTISVGTLSPAFATATTSYSVTEAYATSSIMVTATAASTAIILINGTAVASGSASTAIPLSVGKNTISVAVTDNGGTTVSNYTVTVNRSGNAALANFTINAGTLSPAFASGTYSYGVTMPADVGSISITPTLADTTGTITINGKAVATGTASPNIQLALGSNTITTVTTAADGVTTQTYTLTAIRPTANANLAGLHLSNGSLSPSFAAATLGYTASVANTITSITITPITSDPNATATVNGAAGTSGSASGPISLTVGANTIITVVTAQDGSTTKTYTVTVTRAAANNASLSAFTISRGALSPAFSTNTTSYTASVVNGVTSMIVTPTTADANATVTVNGITVISGAASQAIALSVGANNITVLVTAQDGVTTKTYTVTITRAPSSNANLSALKISKGTLTPVFASGTTSYTASVVNGVSSMTLTPTTADPTATIAVNGTPVTSGTASGAILLAVGANTITTKVTAQDGITTVTYTLTVTRASGSVDGYNPGISVTGPTETPALDDEGILVHQAVSPNGDGINDFLLIDGIQAFPDNKLSIMNRNGQLIFQAKGYDNSSKVFDGHSNKNGQMQLPGTYFYELDYTVKGITKTKTGFLVLKY